MQSTDTSAWVPEDFSGVVLAARGGGRLLHAAYGLAERANGLPNTLETRFGTASAGKAFVAAGIMTLLEAGRLTLTDTLGALLAFDLHAIDPEVTVFQLLNHTSGVPDYCDEDVVADYADLWRDYPNYKIRTSADLLPLFINQPMKYPRGERFAYNNSGYVLLGLVIEAVTGMPFDAYLQRAVFAPLGMDSTGYFALDRLPERCAGAYIWDAAEQVHYTNIYSVDVKGTGAGGAFNTAGDIERFWRGLAGGRLLRPETFEMMVAPQTPDGEYGLGFWRMQDGTPYFQGEDPGVTFMSSFDRERDLLVVAMSNMADDVWAVHRAIRAGLMEEA